MSPTFTILTKASERPTLAEAQRLVGGYVELVSATNSQSGQLLVHEEELILNRKPVLNNQATAIAGRPIFGNALLLTGDARWED